jgi:hypothetical protein
MIYIWNHDIARQRQQELLAAAERSRLARIAGNRNAQAQTGYCKNAYAALLARVRGVPRSSTDVSRGTFSGRSTTRVRLSRPSSRSRALSLHRLLHSARAADGADSCEPGSAVRFRGDHGAELARHG